jgi:membrane peptidoglycan carboxypeptidase
VALSSARWYLLGFKASDRPLLAIIFSALRRRRLQHALLAIAVAATACALVLLELRASWLQSHAFAAIATRTNFKVLRGPSDSIRFPQTGPYDERLGYSRIPDFLRRARSADYFVDSQARDSKLYLTLTNVGVYPIYPEKNQAGLQLLDRDGKLLYEYRYPERAYREYSQISKLVVDTLLFIENRTMLEPRRPRRNPAFEWQRLAHAAFDYGMHAINPRHEVIGGSTLATQLEKIRHSPAGRTHSAGEKLRQMLSASLRAYQDGGYTLAAQHRIVRDYVNSLPLAAATAHGEVIGLGDGLWTWYGADLDRVNQLLKAPPEALDTVQQHEQARAYRQVVSLLLATRTPSRYLVRQPRALAEQTDRYLRVLHKEGVIATPLRDLALRERISVRPEQPALRPNFVQNKARDLVRANLLPLLGVQNTYALDRLDFSVTTTLDAAAQQAVTRYLRDLTDPGYASQTNLRQPRLLAVGDPHSVIYSFTLYERGPGLNLLRVRADNYDQPLNINEGTKLELGSTAKLRTLINYLQIIEELHAKYAHSSAYELSRVAIASEDRLTAWAIGYLATTDNENLRPMLEAALDRRYSASPAEGFFTAGGLHYFRNFESSDDTRIVSIREAFERSVNLVFIRLMRDIKRYYIYRAPTNPSSILANRARPLRRQYFERFADEEGRRFLWRFYREYYGLSPDEAREKLVRGIHASPRRLAVIYRSICPDSSLDEFTAFLKTHLPAHVLKKQEFEVLYDKYAIDKFNLPDRGYLARVHPLKLWLLWYLRQRPGATFAEVVNASAQERQQAYAWLFRTSHTKAQNQRIRILLEEDAFQQIWREWRRTGYPFERLVPSYATAIGVSGDTPEALTELMGIIINEGVRYPRCSIQQLHFAKNTPMETILSRRSAVGERVISADVAALIRDELVRVVENGTARRAHGGIKLSSGRVIPLGGKTGTGDNRVKIFGPGGHLIESRVANRTAAFTFMIGDRFFGTVMAFVPGESAGNYEFTSSLAVQVLKDLEPTLKPLMER